MFKKVIKHEKFEKVGELHNYDVYHALAKSLGQPCVSKDVFKPIRFILPEGIQTEHGNNSYGSQHIEAKHAKTLHALMKKATPHESMMACLIELIDLINDPSQSNIVFDLKNNRYLLTAKLKVSGSRAIAHDGITEEVPFVLAFFPKNNFNFVVITLFDTEEAQYQAMCCGSHRFKPINPHHVLHWKPKTVPVVHLDAAEPVQERAKDGVHSVENCDNTNNAIQQSTTEPQTIDDPHHNALISSTELAEQGHIESGFYSEFMQTIYLVANNLQKAMKLVIAKEQELVECNQLLDKVEPMITATHLKLKDLMKNDIYIGALDAVMDDIDNVQSLMVSRQFNIGKDFLNMLADLMAPVLKLQAIGLSYLIDDEIAKYNAIVLSIKSGLATLQNRDEVIINNKSILYYSFLLCLKKCLNHYNLNLEIIHQADPSHLAQGMKVFATYVSDSYLEVFQHHLNKIDPRTNIKHQGKIQEIKDAFKMLNGHYIQITTPAKSIAKKK